MAIQYPDAENEWDNQWLRVNIAVKAGAFNGSFTAGMMISEFKILHDYFSLLYNNLKGEIAFESIEYNLEMNIKGDGIGHFNAQVTARDDTFEGAVIKFHINFDQTFLPEIINQLEDIIKTYPNTAQR